MTSRLSRSIALLVTTSLAGIGSAAAQTLPGGGRVVSGDATIRNDVPGAMTIEQKTGQAVIDWHSFSVGEGGRVDIVQPDAASRLLNRVTGDTRSTIAGQIHANGQVFLINPNGIVITPTGTVNASGFVASTLGISNEDFVAGRYRFAGASDAGVVNGGRIRVASGGYAALIGGTVRNDGLIAVSLGRVAMAAGEAVTLDPNGDGFLQVALPSRAGGAGALVDNAGSILAPGSRVVLQAEAARELVRRAVNMSGVIEARSVSGREGAIVLDGGSGKLAVSGRVDAGSDTATGGVLTLTARDIALEGAELNAAGATGGGRIRVGGDWQGSGALARAETLTVDAATRIDASATTTGTGGSVVLWSDGATRFAGRIRATGGANGGDGGNAEVSGKATLDYTGNTDLRATAGQWGTLLLDPYNLTISSGASSGMSGFAANANDSVLNVGTLATQLSSASVVVSTGNSGSQAGNITVATPIAWSTATTLTLSAAGRIQVNEAINVQGAGAKLVLNHGSGLYFGLGASVSFAAGRSGQALTINGTNYTLVRSISDLRGVGGSGAYALANTIDFGSVQQGANVIGSFSGTLEGLGNAVANLRLGGGDNAGLIGWNDGTVSNLLLLNVNVSGGSSVGAVAGNNQASGVIRNVVVTGSISGREIVGGIAGYGNRGTVENATVFANVSAQISEAGGIYGRNGFGTVRNAMFQGAVRGYYGLGGLVGSNYGGSIVDGGFAAAQIIAVGNYGDTGGIIGSGQAPTNVVYDGDLAGVGGGTPTATLTNGTLPAGLDSSVWGATSGAYPYLKSLFPNGAAFATGTVYQGSSTTAKSARAIVSVLAGGGLAGVGFSDSAGAFRVMLRADRQVASRVLVAQDTGGGIGGLYDNASPLVDASLNTGWFKIDQTGSNVTTGALGSTLGSATGGAVTLSSLPNLHLIAQSLSIDSSVSLVGTLSLKIPAAIRTDGVGTLTAGALLVDTNGGVLMDNVRIGRLAGRAGLIRLSNTANVTVGGIGGYDGANVAGLDAGSGLDLRSTGDITLAGAITASDTALRAVGKFVNNAGANAVSGGRWLVYSAGPDGNVFGGLDSANTAVWGTAADAAVSASGNRYVFAMRPVVTAVAADVSKIYGETATVSAVVSATPAVAGAFLGDDLSGLGSALAASAGTAATAGVGSYAITIDTSGLSVPNGYDLRVTNGTLTVNQRPITITIDGKSRVYGAANPALTYTIGGMGLVNGDQLSGGLSTSATVLSGVGDYAITQGTLANANYAITAGPATLTVTPRPITITANAATRVYGDADPALTYTVGGMGLANGDVLSGALSSGTSANSPVGQYRIGQGTLANSGNYTVTQFVDAALTVTPRSIRVTANNLSRIYGDGNPALTYTIGGMGLVAGDSLTGALATGATVTSNVGSYGIVQGTLAASSNYTLDFAGGTLTVQPRPLSIVVDPQSRVYGNANPELTYRIAGSGLVNGDTFTGALTTSATSTSNVGDYAITLGNSAYSSNYALTFVGANLRVLPRPVLVFANDFSRVYGDANPVIGYTAMGLINGDTLTGALVGPSAAAPVGTYGIALGTLTASSNYQLSLMSGTATVTPRLIAVTADSFTRIYGEANPALTYRITGGALPNGDSLTGALATSATIGSGVGSYAITIGSLTAPANYAVDFTAGTLTINPRPITVSANAASRIYGEANPAFGYVIGGMGLVNGDGLAGALATDATATSGVGAYAIGQGSLANANYAISYTGNSLTITPRPISIAANDASRVYGDANPALGYTIGGMGLVNGDVLSGALATSADTGTNVGSYAIAQGTLAASPNYSVTGFTGGTLTITPRALNVRADDVRRVYGDADPVFGYTATGLVNGDALSGALVGPGAAVSVGDYAIGLGTLTASPNYALNYLGGTLTVTPRPISVVADSLARIYGEANPALTYRITGGALPNGDSLTGALATSATIGSGVGSYAITIGSLTAPANYAVDFTAGTLTINPRPITVSANAASRIYGEANPAFGYVIGGMGLVNGDGLAGALATDATATSGVGAYAIGQGSLANANYAISYTGNSLTITPRPISIAANDASRVYGDANPALGYTIGGMGLVNGDVLSGALATSADTGTNVGSYAIAQGTLAASPNYSVTGFTGGTLTITPRAITIAADAVQRIYGDANPTLTYRVGGMGLVNGDSLTGALATSATSTSSIGDYAIAQGSLGASANYVVTGFQGAALTVLPRALVVTADDQRRVFGIDNPPLTYSIGGMGLVNGDSLTGVLATTAGRDTFGGAPITQGTLTASTNYLLRFVPGKLVIDSAGDGSQSAAVVARWTVPVWLPPVDGAPATGGGSPERLVDAVGTHPDFAGNRLCLGGLCRVLP